MKKLIALVLCLLLTVAVLASCETGNGASSAAESKAGTESTPADTSKPEESVPDEASEDPDADILANPSKYVFMDKTYDGQTFTIWTCGLNAANDRISDFVYNENVSEEKLPATVNDALKSRNDKVFETLGVTVKEIYFKSSARYGGDSLTQIRNAINGGDDTFQAISVCLYDCGTLTLEGDLYDLTQLQNLNIENPWWEQSFNKSVTINNKLYFTLGDVGFSSKGATPCVYYNTRLIDSLGLEDPIQLATSGRWTIDEAFRYSKSLCQDSAAPEGMDYLDEFGWAGQYDDMYSMLYGAGVATLKEGGSQSLVLALNNDTAIGTMNKVIELMNDTSYISGNDYFGVSSTPMDLLEVAFEEGRCLFYSGGIDTAITLDMNDVYGILPVPKYSTEQDDYYSLINTWVCNAYAIPTDIDEDVAEFAGAVLDCMGYYSWSKYPDSVAYNYYEKMLKNQKLSREDSEAMLDLIFSKRGCEVGTIFQIGKINGSTTVNDMLQILLTTGAGFVSTYSQYESIFEEDLASVLDFFEQA